MKMAMRFDRHAIRLLALLAMMLSSASALAVQNVQKASAGQTQLPHSANSTTINSAQSGWQGESTTLVPSGSLLLLGGQDASGLRNTAFVENPDSGALAPLSAQLNYARAWHTATVLPDGRVFVLGGVGEGGAVVSFSELLNTTRTAFTVAPPSGLTARAFHSATLLTDGQVLIAGGVDAGGNALGTIELWDSRTGQSTTLPVTLETPRSQHTAMLLPDGSVLLWGGVDTQGQPISYGEIIDPATATVRIQSILLQPSRDPTPPQLEASLPLNGATGVPVDVVLSLRFSKPLSITSVNGGSNVIITGPDGVAPANVIAAEGGMLVFITPQAALTSGTDYTLSLSGLTDNGGQVFPAANVGFTTVTSTPPVGGSGSSGNTGQAPSVPGTGGSEADAGSAPSSGTATSSSTRLARSSIRQGHHSVVPVPFDTARLAAKNALVSGGAKAAATTSLLSAANVKADFTSNCDNFALVVRQTMKKALVTTGGGGAPEIVELARSLNNDPDLIYQYVHDNIEFSPMFGTLKGPVGTLLDGRGDSFDQSALMIALLSQASLSNSAISNPLFEFGQLSLNNAQLASWLGVDGDPYSIGGVLADGGIPGTVDPGGHATLVGHVWVKVSINGMPYVFDPAFKTHTWSSGIVNNLASAMGYSQAQFIADAHAKVTPTSIQGVNRAGLRNDLTRYAGNLAAYIKGNYPSAGMTDIVGGGTIVPTTLVNGKTIRQTSNPHQAAPPAEEWTSIPAEYHGTVSITMLPNYYACEMYNTDDLYGHRVSVLFDSSYVPTFYLDGTPVFSSSASSPGATNYLMMKADFYWAKSASITQFSSIAAVPNQSGVGYAVVLGFDQVGRGMVEKHRKLLNQAITSGAPANSEAVLGESLTMIGYTWLAEVAAQERLSDQLLGTTTQSFVGGGIVGESLGQASTLTPYVDMPMNSVGSPARINGASQAQGWTGNALAAWLDGSGTSSAFESAVLEQTQAQVPGFGAASTTKLLDIGIQNGDTIFDINNANTSNSQQYYTDTIRPQMAPNYNADDLSAIDNYVSQGYRIIAPLHGNISVGAWTGVGFKAVQTSGYGEFISGTLSGGYGGTNDLNLAGNTQSSQPAPPSSPTANNGAFSNLLSRAKQAIGDPIDHKTGSFLFEHEDLTVGPKQFPYGLSFQRSYQSAAQGTSGPLGNGWTHNYAITASVNSDGFTGMGQGSPLNAVSSIVALYVSSNLMSGQAISGQQNLQNFTLETVVNRWFTDQLTQNVVNISQPSNTEEFTKLPDGVSYAPPLGSATVLKQNGSGFVYQTKSGVTINFNSSGQISNWNNAAGASVSFGYSGGLLTSVSNAATGRQLTLSYSGGQLTSVTDGARTVNYSYANGNLTAFTDALQQQTKYGYDTSGVFDTAGHLTQVFYPSNPNNPFVTNFYDSLGRVKQQKDANGNTSQVLTAGSRTEVDDPAGNRHVLYMDPYGNITADIEDYGTSHLNLTTVNRYDGQGNVLNTIMPEGNSVSVSYDSYFNPLSITNTPKPGSGLVPLLQKFTYTSPVSSLPNYEEVQTFTDANGNQTSYLYNGTGTIREIDPPAVSKPGAGTGVPKQLFTYTAIGLLQSVTDAEGRVTRYDYDDSSHPDEVTTVTADYGRLNLATQYGYNSYGDVNSVTDANGNQTNRQFDASRRLQEVDAPTSTGAVTQYTYYPDGQVETSARRSTATSPATWETTQYAYTLSGKLSVVTDPLGSITTNTYDVEDRVHTVTQQVTATQSRRRTYSYDVLSRLYQLRDTTSGGLGTVLETHSYTPNGKEQRFTDADNNATTYVYDGFDRLDHAVYPDQTTEKFQYDGNSNAVLKTTRSGQTISFIYDPLNRVATKTPQGEGTGRVTYGYDYSGRLLQALDSSSGVPYEVAYDTAGRPYSYTDQQGRNTQVQYDGVGNRTMVQWPAGTNGENSYFVAYQFDPLNRMTDVLENGSASNLLAHYDWDSLSRQTLITYGDGTTDAYSQHDADDNVQTLTQTFAGGSSVNFSYSWFNNHQRQSVGVDNSAFQYVPPPGTINYGPVDPDNGLTSSTTYPGAGYTSYTYDGNHNLTFDGTNALTYDVENRLIQAQNAVWGTSSYLYDPLGQRKQKQVGDVVTQFVLVGRQEIADYNGTGVGTPWMLTVRGLGGLPLAAITPSTGNQLESIAYYHHDLLGSTTASTQAGTSGAAEVYVYSDFGEPSGGSFLPYRFAGYRYDQETGLYYVQARYYSPGMGRFLQPDPIGLAGGNNLYAYVGNDPVNLIDPSGLCATGLSNLLVNPTTANFSAGAGSVLTVGVTNVVNNAAAQYFGGPNVVDPNSTAYQVGQVTGVGIAVVGGGLYAAGAGAGGSAASSPETGVAGPAATAPEAPPAFPDKVFDSYAPNQVEPGTRTLQGQHIDDTGNIEPWTAHYDEYGRLTARDDYNAGNAKQGIPDDHYHTYEWGPGQNPQETGRHIPGQWPGANGK